MSAQLSPISTRPGFVILLLSPDHPFHLQIPIDIIGLCCLKPRKYLRYIGWCVLGRTGDLTDEEGNSVPLDGELIDRAIYRYRVEEDGPIFRFAVNPEVMKERTSVLTSTSTATREPFAQRLLERDGGCIWSGFSSGDGLHLVPFGRGDQFRSILANRPLLGEVFEPDVTVNDVRNGVMVNPNIHRCFDKRQIAVLMTPNPILSCEDVPARHHRTLEANISYPANRRYTLQWIVRPIESDLATIFNNVDAAFLNQDLPQPSPLLLHYIYGAVAVQRWGGNTTSFTNCADIIAKGHCINTVAKPARNRGEGGGSRRRRMSDALGSGTEESDSPRTWDAEEIVLFFWSNTPAARERRAKEEEEFVDRMEEWRSGVT